MAISRQPVRALAMRDSAATRRRAAAALAAVRCSVRAPDRMLAERRGHLLEAAQEMLV